MTIQQAHEAADLKHAYDKIDRLTRSEHGEVLPAAAPGYGHPQRDAINSVVDGVVGDICGKIGELRKTLDIIEAAVLRSAAKSKGSLNEHVGVCIRVNDEVKRLRDVVAGLEIAADAA